MRKGFAWIAVVSTGLFPILAYGDGAVATDPLQNTIISYSQFVEGLKAGKQSLQESRDGILKEIQAGIQKQDLLTAKQKEIDAQQQRLTALQSAMDQQAQQVKAAAGEAHLVELQESWFDRNNPFHTTDAEKRRKTADRAYRQAKENYDGLGEKLRDQQKVLQKMRMDFDADLKKAQAGKQKVDALNGQLASWDSTASLQIQQKMSTFARDVYDQMKGNSYDARILMADFNTLQAKYQLSGEQLQQLRDELDSRMGMTLMGDWVNGQIKKAMLNVCEIQAQCAAKNSDGLSQLIDRTLNVPSRSDARTTQNKAKTVQGPSPKALEPWQIAPAQIAQ